MDALPGSNCGQSYQVRFKPLHELYLKTGGCGRVGEVWEGIEEHEMLFANSALILGAPSQHNFGPSVDGIFSQASNGIVTRMGFWLMPNPGGMLPFMISFKHRDDLIDAVDTLRPMMLSRLLGNIPSLRLGMWDAATYGSKSHYWPEHNGRPVPEDIEDRILEQEDLGHWVFYGMSTPSTQYLYIVLTISLLHVTPRFSLRRLRSHLPLACVVPTSP